MIDKNSLKEIGNTTGINNLGYVEKDYLQDIVLSLIYRNVGKELIFKGGTALYKFYNLNRFSEDLDFTVNQEFDQMNIINKVKQGLENYGASSELEKNSFRRGTKYTFRIEGPLFRGERRSLCSLSIDLNSHSHIENFERNMRFTNYPDIVSFEVLVASKEEIAAEKVRAIMTRDKARDIYDLWFLIKKGIFPSQDLIQRKLDYYDLEWDYSKFEDALEGKKRLWNKELPQLVLKDNLPEFEIAEKEIKEEFEKTFSGNL